MVSSTIRRPSWRTVTPVLALAVIGLAACSNSQQSSDVKGTTPPVFTGTTGAGGAPTPGGQAVPASDSVSAQLKDPSGAQVGIATIAKTGGYLTITVDAHGLNPGFHGMHFHTVGKCEPNSTAPSGGPAGNFLSAGGHLGGASMGTTVPSGYLPPVQARQDGTAHLVTTTDAVSFDDVKGKALIIHAGPDNFDNIPSRYTQSGSTNTGPDAETMATGDAGARVACGVVG